MINTATALNKFYNSFDIPAYMEGTIPEEVVRPYITYQIAETEWGTSTSHYARIWYRGTNLFPLLQKVDEIKERLSDGVIIECEGGYIIIRPETPFVQIQNEDKPEDKYAYLNMKLDCRHR